MEFADIITNSPLFGFALEITAIRHAMAVLGEREKRPWIRLVVGAAEQKCSELVLMAWPALDFANCLPSERVRSVTCPRYDDVASAWWLALQRAQEATSGNV